MPELSALEICRLAPSQVYRALTTSPQGLSADDVRRRTIRDGPNSLQALRRTPLISRFARQFTHFLALLLWVAAGLAFLADALHEGQGMATLGWAILGVILINAVFAFLQEYKAERAVQALRNLLPAKAWVMRDGQQQQIARSELVPGDVLILEEGEQVPADARLTEAVGMRVDNSSLTGESKPQRRIAEPITDGHPLDIPNLVFAGTTVLSGHGQGVVFATGLKTEFGKIARLTTTVQTGLSPLQQEIVKVTHVVAGLSLVMGLIFFTIGVGMGLGFWTSAIFGIGIIVANVPEGLLPTVTLALAMGSQRMAARKALIKHLASVETLGCTTVICTDKTGTLTENRMRVDKLYVDDLVVESRESCLFTRNRLISAAEAERWRPLFDAMVHCNNAKRTRRPDGRSQATGDPTETALLEFAADHGLLHRPPLRRMGELPFDADRKRMTTLHWGEGRLLAFTKGAPESVLPLCTRQQSSSAVTELTLDERKKVLAQGQVFAQQAYRVLALAMREVERGVEELDADTVEHGLTFLGLVAMMDPPHREVPDAITTCRRAGIRVIMITGDHPLTALAIARKIGLAQESVVTAPGRFVPVIEGSQIDTFSDDQLRRLLTPTSPGEPDPIFARMAPRHKMRIVSVLKGMREVVAVTGDGVNDAPALKTADIGIAMGVAGTDVAKETASMILLDDNFATIVSAIEEGRAVFTNIRKFITYVLASNVPEVMPYLAFGLSSAPLALTVPQILAVDLGTDMVPALALAAEPPHGNIMDEPPRPRTERLLNREVLVRAYGFLGLIETAIAMGGFFLYLHSQGWTWGTPLDWNAPLYKEATTVTFAGIVAAQAANVFACRSDRTSAFRLGWFSNPLIVVGIVVESTLLLILTYSPVGHWVLGTASLPAWIFIPLIVGAIGLLLADELHKLVGGRLKARQPVPAK
ncbi:cation-translocating P-type ATPase [Nitrospira defluvii]|uniref:Calcium-transporting ATPase n=1 Tax=Nitrospira defluvii TaxID=330214 RepID=A0ABN7LSN3_9BACT|nr:cation-transporting P-type ATPase [Nitrospira defluvii]CAE6758372.1 Putative Calcium-transporting ATPase [Nitrospira defluvii]